MEILRVKNIPADIAKKIKFKKLDDTANVFDIPAVWYDKGIIKLIDQRLLPLNFELFEAKNITDVAYTIKEMVIRGAPAIGGMAAYGLAQAAVQQEDLENAAEILRATRPTAYDLFYAIKHMLDSIDNGLDPLQTAEKYVAEIISRCRSIGRFGNDLIKNGDKLLTHCNAGALATVDFGTALAPMRFAHEHGKKIFVYVDETRPRLQGAKLTAWELYNEEIPHSLIVDNAAGFYLGRGEIDLVITGADRIASNGDAANKIGTYEKAVLAKENGVPFYIAAPRSTFDLNLKNGSDIPIEERNQNEVLMINDRPITISGVNSLNPAFDVTPNKYITAFITEFGVFKPDEIEEKIGINDI